VGRVHVLQVPSPGDSGIEVDALDGDLRRVELADQSPDGGVPLDGAYTLTAGRPVIPDFVPRRMRWSDPLRRPLPDFDQHLILNVSGRARGLIEVIEPCVHQFLPVIYRDPAGKELEQRHFLIACNRIDSVDPDRTTMLLWQERVWQPANLLPPDEIPPGFDPTIPPRLVFSLRRIGRCHLWRDPHLRIGPFVSEALAAALIDSGMTGVDLNAGTFQAL
jgi:hypothetical protein